MQSVCSCPHSTEVDCLIDFCWSLLEICSHLIDRASHWCVQLSKYNNQKKWPALERMSSKFQHLLQWMSEIWLVSQSKPQGEAIEQSYKQQKLISDGVMYTNGTPKMVIIFPQDWLSKNVCKNLLVPCAWIIMLDPAYLWVPTDVGCVLQIFWLLSAGTVSRPPLLFCSKNYPKNGLSNSKIQNIVLWFCPMLVGSWSLRPTRALRSKTICSIIWDFIISNKRAHIFCFGYCNEWLVPLSSPYCCLYCCKI